MKKGKMILYTVLWFAIFAVLSIFFKPVQVTACAAQEGQLLVAGKSGWELPVVYEEITGIEYREELNYGTMLDGIDDGNEKSGQWQNDEFGQYLLCVNTKVKPCIVLRMEKQLLVINFESRRSTQALYEALLEQMDAVRII